MFCCDVMEIRKYKEHLEEWHNITVWEEVERAMERARQDKSRDIEGSDQLLSWEDVLKYNDLFTVVDKNNVGNITSLSTKDHRDISVNINQDYSPPSMMNCQMSISSTLSRSQVTFTKVTNIVSSPSSKISTEPTSRYSSKTAECLLLDLMEGLA